MARDYGYSAGSKPLEPLKLQVVARFQVILTTSPLPLVCSEDAESVKVALPVFGLNPLPINTSELLTSGSALFLMTEFLLCLLILNLLKNSLLQFNIDRFAGSAQSRVLRFHRQEALEQSRHQNRSPAYYGRCNSGIFDSFSSYRYG